MNIRVDRNTWTRKPRCRHCAERAQWDLTRDATTTWGTPERLCDKHLSVALRNLGLSRLHIEHTATCTATVRP